MNSILYKKFYSILSLNIWFFNKLQAGGSARKTDLKENSNNQNKYLEIEGDLN